MQSALIAQLVLFSLLGVITGSGLYAVWKLWQHPTAHLAAKLLISAGILFLLMPLACGGSFNLVTMFYDHFHRH